MPQKSATSPNPSHNWLVITQAFHCNNQPAHMPIILHFVDQSTLSNVFRLVAGALDMDKKGKKKTIDFSALINNQSDSQSTSSGGSTTTSSSSNNDSSSSDSDSDHSDIALG